MRAIFPSAALPYRLCTIEGDPLAGEDYPSRRALQGETIRNAQLVMERLDGSRFPVFVQAGPLRDAEGTIVQAVVVFQDITRLREAEQLKDDFLSLISHEFRTPLTAINGGARLLADAGDAIDPETRAELLQDIVAESAKLDQMLSNMLSVAAIMAGRLIPLAEPVLVDPIARRTSAEVAAAAPNHRFAIQIPAGLPAAEGDAELLIQVMRNLYENAVKYSPQGGTVLTTAESDGHWVRVQVHDNGIGLAPGRRTRSLPALSARGHRPDHPWHGTRALSEPYADRSAGWQHLRQLGWSRQGLHLHDQLADHSRIGRGERMRKRLILVVDDEPPIVRLVKTKLQLDGFAVVTAGRGEEAVPDRRA